MLRFSPIVTEAINLANEHQGTVEILGSPIKLGWFVRGSIGEPELYFGESELFIPINGPKNRSTLIARAVNREGIWIFTKINLLIDGTNSLNLLEISPNQRPRRLETSRRVYIVPIGSLPEVGLRELPQYYREKYNLSVELLDPIPLDASVYDVAEGKVVDDELEELLKRRIPRIANDPAAVLIGITAEDMYVRSEGTSSMSNSYNIRGRFGFVSTFLLTRRRFEGPSKDGLLRARVRKLISRNIGVSAYRLPMSDDPTSVVSESIGWVGNIDLLSESFEGLGPRAVVDEYRVAKNEPSYQPKLLSTYSKVEPKKVDGRYPCLLMKRHQNEGTRSAAFDVTVDKCLPKSFIDTDADEIEVDLRSGLIITKRTDLFVPGRLPVAATRCYRSWDSHSRTFGRNTTLSWDMYPVGDMHPHTYMDLYLCGGSKIHYERISQGSGFADVLYEHRQTVTPFLGSRMRWNGNAWDLKFVDGAQMLFPGTYQVGRGNDGGLMSFLSATGESVTIERDRRRNLKSLSTSSQGSITFEYDSWNRVIKAIDHQARVVNYAYDVVGRLVEVQSVDSTSRFDYDYADITAIYENGRRLVQFQYSSGLVEQISRAPDPRLD